MLAILRQRNFALLWAGQALSAIGDWILWIGLPFYVYGKTGSALATGAMFMVTTAPGLLFGSLAGVLVDQWDRRRVMFMADLSRTGITLLLLATLNPGWLWLIYPLAFLDATVAQFFNPAKSALLPNLVKQEQLLAANTLNSFSGDLAMLVGPALGGLLIGLLGFRGSVLIDAGSFLISALCVFWMTTPNLPAAQNQVIGHTDLSIWLKLWRDWLAGLQLVQQECAIRTIFIVMAVAMFGQGIIFVLWALFVKQVLQGGALEYGWVQVAVAIGGLFGAAILGRAGKKLTPAWLIGCSGMLTGLLLLATFNLPSLRLILALQFVGGIAAVGFFVPSETLLQKSVTDTYRGRIFGAYQTTNALLLLIGQGVASSLGDRIGIVPMLNLSGSLYFLGGAVALVLLARQT
ncbi:MAG: MFS transporter [Caldilineaceae bacterium]